MENNTNLDISSPTVAQELNRSFAGTIKRRMELALEKGQKELDSDFIGLGRELYRQHPQAWKKMEKQWDERFPDMKVDIRVRAVVRHQGLSVRPAGMSENEVKKK
jgi:spore germination protein KC